MSGRTGGCQCGKVRFAVDGELGRASLCHCRMCQKAFGAPFGALVTVKGLRWTRGEPARFASSNQALRGFCPACGTTLTFEPAGGGVDLAIAAFDDPAGIVPVVEMGCESKLGWVDRIAGLPGRSPEEEAEVVSYYSAVRTLQHPDHDTPA